MTNPRISVLMPCRNEVGIIEQSLRSILEQEELEGRFEVIVIDGMSTDGTREVVKAIQGNDPGVILLNNRKRIVPCALNAGIDHARGDIIIRMDAHSEYAPDYVATCVRTLEATGADNVGGPAMTRHTSYFQKANSAAYHSPFSVGGARFHDINYQGKVDTVPYGCWKKSAFEKFGYFDVNLVRNQDDEHNLRITLNGGTVWLTPEIRSWYYPRNSLTGLFNQYRQYGYWKTKIIRKHRLLASLRHLVPALFIVTLFLLALLSTQFSLARMTLYSLLGLYIVVLAVASITSAKRDGWHLLPVLPVVFVAYHFGYGTGFLQGLLWFVRRKDRTSDEMSSLTRC